MVKMTLSLVDGSIRFDETTICLNSQQLFLTSIKGINPQRMDNNGYTTYSLEVQFLNSPFYFGASYKDDNFHTFGLTWCKGNCFKKGWDSCQDDLVADIQQLNNLVITEFQLEPDVDKFNLKEYYFDWGALYCCGHLKNMQVNINILNHELKKLRDSLY